METLSPTLNLISSVRKSLTLGRSPREGIETFCRNDQSKLAQGLRAFLVANDVAKTKIIAPMTAEQRLGLHLIERSLKGEPVLAALTAFEDDLFEKSVQEIDAFGQRLKQIALLPLLLLIFPAYLILLLGPLLHQLESVL
jgi:hypothetical protein